MLDQKTSIEQLYTKECMHGMHSAKKQALVGQLWVATP